MIGRVQKMSRAALALTVCSVIASTDGIAQQTAESIVEKPLATRAELDSLTRHASDAELRHRAQSRLREGDFRQGDLILLQVQGHPQFSDTLTVGSEKEVRLPATAATVSLDGVLMSEIEDTMREHVARFVKNPVVTVRPFLRLSIQGEVGQPGFHPIPADAPLSQALMVAGGTTSDADLSEARLERDGKAIMKGQELMRAIASGRSLSELHVRGGDQIFIERRDEDSLLRKLRILGLIAGIAGGIYGATQIF